MEPFCSSWLWVRFEDDFLFDLYDFSLLWRKIRAEFGAGEPLLKTRGRPGCNIEDSKAPRGTREGFQRPQASHLGAEKGPQKRPKKAPRQVFFRGAEKTLIPGTKNMLLSTLWNPKGLPNDSPGPTSGADRGSS